jgi:SNF2 family DNA or RNA helicase
MRGVEVMPVIGSAKERVARLRRDANVYTINYEQLPWLVDHLGPDWPFDTVVADESTRLKSFRLRNGGVRAQAISRLAHTHIRRWINLTGLAAPNGLVDLWGQTWFLDQGARLGRTFKGFMQRWFVPTPKGDRIEWEPAAHAQDEITDKLRDLCLSVSAADHFKLPPLINNTIYVDLPAPARRIYERMQREMYTEIAGAPVEAFNGASKTIKCLQLANGAAYIDTDNIDESTANLREWREVHDVKLQALESVIAEAAGAPVLVAYHFKPDLIRLLRHFKHARVLDKNPATIHDWNAGRIQLLLAQPDSCGHGLNLQDGGNILVFFAHWWALDPYAQMVERLGPTRQAQSGHNRPLFLHHIVARDTVDELVMERRITKRSVNDVLMGAMKRAA